jgi:hypothetical protein
VPTAGLSEDDISVKFITPALHKAGWDEDTQIRRQVSFTKGRIIVRGKLVARGKPKRADFVLYFQHIPIALIEAKKAKFGEGPSCGTGGFLTCAIRHMRERYVKKPKDEAKLQASLRAVEKKQLPHMLCVTNLLLHGIEDPSFVLHDNTLARPYISWEQKDRVDIILANRRSAAKRKTASKPTSRSTSAPRKPRTCSWRCSSACSNPAAVPPSSCLTARCSAKA